MSKPTLLMLSATAMFGAALVAPSAAFAQFGPPPGPPPAFAGPPPGFAPSAPPPGLGAGGPPLGGAPGAPPRDIAGAPPHFSRLDGAAGPHGLVRGGPTKLHGVEARAVAYGANGHSGNGYASYRNVIGYHYGTYAAAAAAAAGRPDSSSEVGCYYVSKYFRYGYRRVLVCNED